MPLIKKTNQAVLSWDTFPEEPLEAKDWKPNPDDVAKPGKLKDPRFNRDPQEERRKAASKRDARLGVSSPTSPRESAPAVNSLANAHPGWNNWSARTLQSAQSVSASATNVSLPVNTPLLVVPASQGNAVNSSSYGRPVVPAPTATLTTTTSANTSTATPVPKEAKTYSPVMRQVTSKPSAPSKLSIRFTSQPESIASKSGIPAWAGPLEKLLAEGKANERSSMATSSSPKGYTVNPGNDVERPQPQAKPRSVDMDAHYKAATEASRRVTNTSITTIVGDEETQAVELESLSLAKNVSGITEQALKSLEHAPPANGPEKLSVDYQRPLDVALIKFMEGELDLGSHGTRAQLLALNDDLFKQYFDKMKTAHKQLWISEKLRKRPLAAVNGAHANDMSSNNHI